jgi:hypothetical protein
MTYRNGIHVVLAVAFVLVATLSGTALTARRTTHFTLNAAVRLDGAVLPPGTYVFEIANPDGGSNVTRVLDRKRSKVYVTAITRAVTRRPSAHLDATLVFGEASPSAPRRVNAWYPAGETTGREFLR